MNKQRLKTWAADPARVFGLANALAVFACLICGLMIRGIAGVALAILGSVGYAVLRIIASTTKPKEQK